MASERSPMFSHLRTKFLAMVIPMMSIVIIVSYMISLSVVEKVIGNEIQERISAEKEVQKAELEKKMGGAKQIALDIADFAANTYHSEKLEAYTDVLKSMVSKNAFILGAGIWFEPFLFRHTQKYVGPYVYKPGGRLTLTLDYSNSSYNYFAQDYYVRVKTTHKGIFTNMYYDAVSGLYVLTCSEPILAPDRRFIGCVTVDVELNSLQKFVEQYNAAYEGSVFIISKDGTYLAAGDQGYVKNKQTIADLGGKANLRSIAKMLQSVSGQVQYAGSGQRFTLYYDTVNELGWKIVFQVPQKSTEALPRRLAVLFLLLGALLLLAVSLFIVLITSRTISRPVELVMEELEKIGSNELAANPSSRLSSRSDEFGSIGRGIEQMKQQLKQYQEDLGGLLKKNIEANEHLTRVNDELIHSREEMQASSKYNASLLEVIPDIVIVLSRDGRFLDCVGAREQMYVPKEFFIGKHLTEIMPEEVAAEGLNKINQALLTGEMQKMEYEVQINDRMEYHELRMVEWYGDNVIGVVRNITESYKYLREMEYISFHDPVTGVHNRRYFEKRIQELNQSENYPLCVIISDLNGLKLINDTFGHVEGDRLLQKYAALSSARINGEDLFCRIGGDEFGTLLTRCDAEMAEEFIRRIKKECSEEKVGGLPVSVSCGYCIAYQKEQQLQDVIKLAEDRMYRNKMFEASSRGSDTIQAIIRTLHEKNPQEEQHSRRVAKLCENMAKGMGLPEDEVKKIRTEGLLHDIGKIGISEELLNKKGSLGQEEYAEICKHPEIGYRILGATPSMLDISNAILSHHERWDGNGYPKGLKMQEIPLHSRIIAIADTYDAMTSERSYRHALPAEVALKEIEKNAGTQFDPELALFFIAHAVEEQDDE